MKKENYYKWNDASISDIEWEQMMGETDFELSLIHIQMCIRDRKAIVKLTEDSKDIEIFEGL